MTFPHGGNILAVCRQRGWNPAEVLDFSASINPLGLSPKARRAIEQAVDRVVYYPEPYGDSLAEVLAEEWNISPAQILLGNGATELIYFLSRVWRQMPVTLAIPVFTEFHRAFPHAKLVPFREPGRLPLRGLLVLSQPNNPTGELLLPSTSLRRPGITLVDESFLDFSETPSLLGASPNLLVLRSLTKFYALPGLRLGALIGPESLICTLRRQREPWQVNTLAAAAAVEAVRDRAHAERSRTLVATERERIWDRAQELPGVMLTETHANFFFAQLDYPSRALCDFLLERKILIRDCAGWPGVPGDAVRFAIRTPEENDRLIAAWKEFRWPPA